MALDKELLKRLRGNRSQQKVANDLHIAQTTYSGYENGTREPDSDMLQKIADHYKVSVDYLLGRSEQNEIHWDSFPNIRQIKKFTLPLMGEIACGEPSFANNDYEGFIDVDTDMKKKADFCLIARGDSMIGDYIRDGDVVLIRKQPQVENGEIAAVAITDEAGDGEITLKHVYNTKTGILLVASNPAYPSMTFEDEKLETVRILGKYVGFIHMTKEK